MDERFTLLLNIYPVSFRHMRILNILFLLIANISYAQGPNFYFNATIDEDIQLEQRSDGTWSTYFQNGHRVSRYKTLGFRYCFVLSNGKRLVQAKDAAPDRKNRLVSFKIPKQSLKFQLQNLTASSLGAVSFADVEVDLIRKGKPLSVKTLLPVMVYCDTGLLGGGSDADALLSEFGQVLVAEKLVSK
jgi:hypothetical protein